MPFALTSKPSTAVKFATKRKPGKASLISHSGRGNAGSAFRPPIVEQATDPTIQTKLSVSEPNDKYEQEADRVADEVMRMPESNQRQATSTSANTVHSIQRVCNSCQDEDKIQTKSISSNSAERNANPTGFRNPHGVGVPLPENVRSFFEPRFGYDFGRVRVHSDQSAADSARSVSARAYTLGHRVVFGAGEYSPGTTGGQRLLAHELTHVVQQGSGSASSIQRQPIAPAAQNYRNCNLAVTGMPGFANQTAGINSYTIANQIRRRTAGLQLQRQTAPQGTAADRLLEGLARLPRPDVENYCQPLESVEQAREIHRIAVDSFVPALRAQFGPDVGNLWRHYLNRRHGDSLGVRQFSDPSSTIIRGHGDTRGFANSLTTRNRQTQLADAASDWYQNTCPSLPQNFPVGFPVERIFSQNELNHPTHFNYSFEIPSNIAGAVGSSDAGPDSRRISGHVNFLRSVDNEGRTTGVRLSTDFRFRVRDSIDFCPGNPGSELEQNLTIPLSQLEKSGEIWPQERLATTCLLKFDLLVSRLI